MTTRHSIPASMPPAFWELLLDRLDPHQPATEAHGPAEHVLCGRWFALHRLHHDKRLGDLANEARIASEALVLLEAGVASEQLINHTRLQALCGQLADYAHPPSWIEQIGRIALGRPIQSEIVTKEDLLNAVERDIEIYQTSSGRGAKLSLQDELVRTVVAALRAGHHELPQIWGYVRAEYAQRHVAPPGGLADLAIVLGDMEEARLIDSMRTSSPSSNAPPIFYPTPAMLRVPIESQLPFTPPATVDEPVRRPTSKPTPT